jgi:NAD(P)-dependent dehydrogenase (short-subunit alcohol dehydrogenase family)
MKKETVLLTGSNGQLGREISNKLSSFYDVIHLDVSYPQDQCSYHYRNVDISNLDAVAEIYRDINPDIVINNAGVSVFSSFMERNINELDHVYDVNLKGTINMINEFAKINQGNKDVKRVVNIASLYGVISADPRIYTDCARNSPEIYAATKAGIIQLTKYYCVHLRDFNIRVNSISPGGIFNPDAPQGDDFIKNYSDRCPMGKMGSAEDVANGVQFLVSHDSSYINGHNLIIDGGSSSW